MNQTKKIHIALWTALLAVVFCFAQKKKSEGDVFFFQYEYQKAINAYEEELSEGILTKQQFLNLADAYFETNNFAKASEAYMKIHDQDTLMDSHHYNKMLQSLSKSPNFEGKGDFLANVSSSFPKELMENMEFNNQLLENGADKNQLDYEIFNLDGNSPQTDFAPSFYNDKLLFSSGRQVNKKLRYEPGNEGYFNIYEADIQPTGQIAALQTFQKAFNSGDRMGWMAIAVEENTPVPFVERQIKSILKAKYDIHPDDERAIGSFDMSEIFNNITAFTTVLKGFSFFVGIFTLLAGVIAISNILLITVKERTQEIGVRRALGATPKIVKRQIVLEAIVLTAFAGLVGFAIAVGVLSILDALFGSGENFPFVKPMISIPQFVVSFVLMIGLSVLIGLLPANRAVKIKPIDALREE